MRFVRLFTIATLVLTIMGLPAPASAEPTILSRTLEVLPAGNKAVNDIGTSRGAGMARQSAGVALAAGAVLEARVTNGVKDVQVNLVTAANVDDSTLSLPVPGTWVATTAKADAGVFFKLKHADEWATAPTVEYRIASGSHFAMPEYRRGNSPAEFFAHWDQSASPFAAIIDNSVSILVPRRDRADLESMTTGRFSNLDQVIDFYRDLVATYDSWLGLDAEDAAAHHRPLAHRYFVRPDRTGWGAAYYMGWNYMGLNGESSLPYILGNDQWLILHEVGHGYDGLMTRPAGGGDLELGEVWNNIYSHAYESTKMGITAGWLYKPNQDTAQADFDQDRLRADQPLDFNKIDHRLRLDVMARILDLTGIDGFRHFNRSLRDLQASGQKPHSTRRTDLIAHHWGAPSGVNLVPWLETFSVSLSDHGRAQLMDLTPLTMAMPLSDIIPNADQTVLNALGISGPGTLVKTSATRTLGVKTNATITATGNRDAIEGRNVTLWDGTAKVATAVFRDGAARFTDLPVGVYTVRYPQSRTTGFVPASDWVLAAAGATASASVTYPETHDFSSAGDVDLRLLGIADGLFAQLGFDRSASELTVLDQRTNEPHMYFPQSTHPGGYASVKVTQPDGTVTLNRVFIGDGQSEGPSTATVPAPVGTRIDVSHREAENRLRPVSSSTGAARNDLYASALNTTYVVTAEGLTLVDTDETAAAALASDIDAALSSLVQQLDTNPSAWFAPRAAEIRSAIELLPGAARNTILAAHGAALETAVRPATEPLPVATPTTPTPTPPQTPTPTLPPTATATPTSKSSFKPTAPYTEAGLHKVNGRDWLTTCEPYSRTVRCRTEIWATVVTLEDGAFVRSNAWTFNNLTYLPHMSESEWQGNPLAMSNMVGFTSGGRDWRTECHTERTGRGACRSYTLTTVYSATPATSGGYSFSQSNEWLFNNIVLFKN